MKYMALGAAELLALLILFDQGLNWPLWLAVLAALAGVALSWTIPFALVLWQTRTAGRHLFNALDEEARLRESRYQSRLKRY